MQQRMQDVIETADSVPPAPTLTSTLEPFAKRHCSHQSKVTLNHQFLERLPHPSNFNMAPPHSATVRSTFSNPNFSTRNIVPPLGDPIYLEHEKINSLSTSSSNTKSLTPYGDKGPSRGTMSEEKRREEINRSMLGDPISMKAETSGSNWGRGAGTRDEEGMKRAVEGRVGSKL